MKSGLRTAVGLAFVCLTLSANAWSTEQTQRDLASAELVERDVVATRVADMLRDQRYADLETQSAQYRDNESRTSAGLWYLTLFYQGINNALDQCRCRNKEPDFWLKAEHLAQGWLDQYPNSPSAQLALARMIVNQARAEEDPDHAFAYYQEAREFLQAHKRNASVDPHWYELMALIARMQEWPEPEFRKLIDEGLDRHPRYHQLYYAAIDYYGPRAGGDAASIEAFARDALERTKAEEGFGIYARIYWYASQSVYGARLFIASKVDWPTMKKGMDDVVEKYPDPWNLNSFARFACLSQDKLKTAQLLNDIGDSPLPEAWGTPSLFEPCKEWALGKHGSL